MPDCINYVINHAFNLLLHCFVFLCSSILFTLYVPASLQISLNLSFSQQLKKNVKDRRFIISEADSYIIHL